MASDVHGSDAPRRKPVIWVIAGVVAAVAVVLVVVLIIRGNGSGSPSGSGSGDPGSGLQTGNEASPGATMPVPSVSIPKPTATGTPTLVPTKSTSTTSAPLDAKVDLASGIEVRVAKIEGVEGEARGPGEIAGPAVRVTVSVRNESDNEVSMSMALVNLYYGTDKTPASALSGPGLSPLPATVGAGKTASGTYVFGVPENDREHLIVEFSYSTESPTVIFSGKG